MKAPRRIEGYAIVSEDGMLANAAGVMPDSLKFEADQIFFERGLDGVDVVVHGRHSHEKQRRSDLRKRLTLTRRVLAVASVWPTTTRSSGIRWRFARAGLGGARCSDARMARSVHRGLGMFSIVMSFISRDTGVRLPGGQRFLPEVPERSRRTLTRPARRWTPRLTKHGGRR